MKIKLWPFRWQGKSRTRLGPRVAELQLAQLRIRELEERLDSIEEEQADLREREARFRILSELISDCCWARWGSTSGATDRTWVNDSFETLTGYSPDEFEQIGRTGLIHPDDLEAALEYVDGPAGVTEHEFRIIRKDGEVRWLREKMQVEQDGDSLLVLGATQDVTAQRDAEQILLEGNRLLEERVHERTRELERTNRRLQEEVAERRRAEEALRRARDAAEAASLAKSRFLANMSHEMRTPLNGILGISELLLGKSLPATIRRQMEMLHSSGDSLLGLIDRVLDFSKIEAGRLSLLTVNFSLAELESSLVGVFGRRAAEKALELRMSCADEVPDRLRGDLARLRQILFNLVDNAIKFTQQGEIEVGIAVQASHANETWLVFTVRDTGMGIDPGAREGLFEPFSQGDDSTARRFGGTGLGLSICRRLAELMGGEISLESSPGKGSTFTVLLPFQVALDTPREAGSELPVDLAELPIAGDYKILVAEDNPVNQEVISLQLRALDLSCRLVSNGAEVQPALEEDSFDLILMDCQMPEVDGYEATLRIRSGEVIGKRIPIVGVTASAIQEDLDRCIDVGMDAVLSKPYRVSQLRELLAQWLPLVSAAATAARSTAGKP